METIGEYFVAEAGVVQAVKVLREIQEAFRKLAELPGIGHFRKDLLDERYRFWVVYSYVIAYRCDVDPVQIIAIVHGARNLDAFFRSRGVS